ncbi:MAG: DUF11 domain-containing protein, partial [Phaeodactylibacter sp.]|nr:DUF11 domain-containing protein [Phaeodactylibacter sp.]
ITNNWPVVVDYGANADQAFGAIAASNGSVYVAGNTELSSTDFNVLLIKVESDGTTEVRDYGQEEEFDFGFDLIERINGGYAIAGSTSSSHIVGVPDATLIKTDELTNTYTNYINGTLFHDLNGDCGIDTGDPLLNDWVLEATNTSDGRKTYGSTDANGQFSILVPSGEYIVRVILKNEYWETCIEQYNGITFDFPYEEISGIDFGTHPAANCPHLTVDVSAPFITPCEEVDYTVTYLNDGPEPAIGAQVAVELTKNLDFVSASIAPAGSVNDSIYFFDLGDLASGQNGTFKVRVSANCNVIDEEAFSLTAKATPDDLCIVDPQWDDVSIDVKGKCNGDEIEFTIYNVGTGDMGSDLAYIVIEDHIMGYQVGNPFQLPAGDSMKVNAPANGSTYRIITEQALYHPGKSFPTAAVEGCVADGGTDYTTGILTEFAENDGNSFISIDVQEGISSSNTVNLRGYPKGYKSDTIAATTDLKYHILFQNNSADTITRVVIRDTLSAYLDVTTIEAGASSHTYDYRIYENGIVKFIFNDINLPPSSVDEAGSKGFVQFKVAQQPDNPSCTEIFNQAFMYVGYDEPVLTDWTLHTSCGEITDFVDVILSDEKIPVPGVEISTFPNPFIGGTTIEIKGIDYRQVNLTIFDNTGRLIRQEQFSGNQYQLERGYLQAGIYYLKLEADGQTLKIGKVIVK